LVQVILGPHPEDARATQEAGGTIRTTAGHLLVDTGAQLTVVENTVAVALGLVPIRYARITGVSGRSDECPVYRMGVVIGMAEDGTSRPHQATFVADVAGVPSPPVKLTHIGLDTLPFLAG
jgi:predicted aspartyl protease